MCVLKHVGKLRDISALPEGILIGRSVVNIAYADLCRQVGKTFDTGRLLGGVKLTERNEAGLLQVIF